MKSNRSLNRILRDELGKGLTKAEVRILARANSKAYTLSELNLDIVTEKFLMNLATDNDGFFRDDQVLANRMKYR